MGEKNAKAVQNIFPKSQARLSCCRALLYGHWEGRGLVRKWLLVPATFKSGPSWFLGQVEFGCKAQSKVDRAQEGAMPGNWQSHQPPSFFSGRNHLQLTVAA